MPLMSSIIFLLVNMAQISSNFLAEVAEIFSDSVSRPLTFEWKDNSCYRSCAHGQSLLCLQLHADEAEGSIQWKMTL